MLKMAELRGAYGTGFVRRLGNVVGMFAGNGRYKIVNYNPNVYNPRTEAQLIQRAKFSFLGRLAAVLGKDALAGMSNLGYVQLAHAFISRNMAGVVMDTRQDPTQVMPALSLENMLLSAGSLPACLFTLQDGGQCRVQFDGQCVYNSDRDKPDGVIITLVVLNSIGEEGYHANVYQVPVSQYADGQAQFREVLLPVTDFGNSDADHNISVAVYVYPYRKNRTNGRTRYGRLNSDSNLGTGGNIHSVDTMVYATRGDFFGETRFAGIRIRALS